MDSFESLDAALNEVLLASPLVTAILAVIGILTVVFWFWSGAPAILGYLVSTPRQMLSVWCYGLFIFGGAALGYSLKDYQGMWRGAGIACGIAGLGTILAYWIRQWVAWSYSENIEK